MISRTAATLAFVFLGTVPLLAPAFFVPSVAAQSSNSDGPLLPPIFRDAVPEPDGQGRWTGEKVTMSLRDADLVETLRTFSRIGDFNLLIQPGISGTVTVELKDVPWDQALSMILRINGLGMEVTHGTVHVARPAELERWAREQRGTSSLGEASARAQESSLLRVSGRLEFLDPAQVVALLELGYLSDRGRASARGRTLTVIDAEQRLKRLARLVSRLDTAEARGDDLSALRRRASVVWPGTTR